jgi:putative peptide zinc metalloprotease protein
LEQNKTSFWNRLKEQASNLVPQSGTLGLWKLLGDRLDFAKARPAAIPDYEFRRQDGRGGEHYYVLKNPAEETYLRLSPKDFYLYGLMDGHKSVQELLVAYFHKFRAFAFSRLGSLVEQLREAYLLRGNPSHLFTGTESALNRRTLGAKLGILFRAFQHTEFNIEGLDAFFERIYQGFFRVFYTRPMAVLMLSVALLGGVLFALNVQMGRYAFFRAHNSLALGLPFVILVNLIVITAHESAHAMTTKHYGRTVRRAGFMIYLGMPAAFVDTTDIWMEKKSARIAVSWAGPYANAILAGTASLVMTFFPACPLNPFLYRFAFLAYFGLVMNLNPLLELDGYYILMDSLDIPLLRRRSLAFVTRGLWAKLAKHMPWTREDGIFAVFGLLALVWTTWFTLFSALIWQHKVNKTLRLFLRTSDSETKFVIIAVVVLFSLPILMRIGRRLFRAVAAIRHQADIQRRKRAVETPLSLDEREKLVASVALLADLPPEDRKAVAVRLRSRSMRHGEILIRQGEKGDRYYVIQHGRVQVSVRDELGHEQSVATLGPLDSFGEIALVKHIPRTATVTALSDGRLFSLDRSDFETLIGFKVGIAEKVDRLIQNRGFLFKLPLFSELPPAQVGLLASKLIPRSVPPETDVIKQGEIGDSFFLIKQGACRVLVLGKGVELHEVARLKEGDYFGEIALLLDVPRTATVRAETPCELLELRKEDFFRLLGDHLFLAKNLEEASGRRLEALKGRAAA